ncbi:MAG: cytochrome b [Gammaproteobacteria bacterium]|nr:cytochrome b [Gammaproteobacteria bacterium]NNF48838.1 cytochrome b [Woeseiaceae bacterium]MBT8093800.1 cytochrome b [Gammaproteobacteria bacterium]MBT8105884.1 cytochrome b [Gammaproteobacteria bacterium]NNK25898.1 cytochrome b [Woeseiaceae bacterium]
MALRNTAIEWGSLARALHWLIAVGILGLILVGLQQAGLERGPEKTQLRMLHSSTALVVLGLMTLRIVWRWMNETPLHSAGFAAWQKLTATVVHWGLYVVVFVQLISGVMTVATTGNGLPFFGIFKIPVPIGKDEDAHHFWEEIHEFAWQVVVVLIVVHVVGALYNHFVLKNDVLRRMTSGVKTDG